jgi:hypothetical protein
VGEELSDIVCINQGEHEQERAMQGVEETPYGGDLNPSTVVGRQGRHFHVE